MNSTAEKHDDTPDRTLPQFRTDSAALHPGQQTSFSLDSGIETDDQASANANHNTPATDGTTDSASAPSLVEAQLAEEQELTPDVRNSLLRIAERRRDRLIDFLTGARQRLGYRERHVRGPAASWLCCTMDWTRN